MILLALGPVCIARKPVHFSLGSILDLVSFGQYIRNFGSHDKPP